MILNTVIDALLKILMAAPALLGMGLMMGFSPALYSITFLALINDSPGFILCDGLCWESF